MLGKKTPPTLFSHAKSPSSAVKMICAGWFGGGEEKKDSGTVTTLSAHNRTRMVKWLWEGKHSRDRERERGKRSERERRHIVF